jgi:hypothetical protein
MPTPPWNWIERGSAFALSWAGREWRLCPDADRPGFYLGDVGPVLGLEGLAARGRFDPDALRGASLVACERRFDRIEATYAPVGWGEMTLRAAWWPGGEQAVDAQIELSARSVGELKAVEVLTTSRIAAGTTPSGARRVWPRDARSAVLSYDGREPDLTRLTTEPPRLPGESPLWLGRTADCPGWRFLALAHPDDVSRRITDGLDVVRDALFGYDLERGVVLRGRLRGVWLPEAATEHAAAEEFRRFLDRPLPLTT